jgi:hypothetical protein
LKLGEGDVVADMPVVILRLAIHSERKPITHEPGSENAAFTTLFLAVLAVAEH